MTDDGHVAIVKCLKQLRISRSTDKYTELD